MEVMNSNSYFWFSKRATRSDFDHFKVNVNKQDLDQIQPQPNLYQGHSVRSRIWIESKFWWGIDLVSSFKMLHLRYLRWCKKLTQASCWQLIVFDWNMISEAKQQQRTSFPSRILPMHSGLSLFDSNYGSESPTQEPSMSILKLQVTHHLWLIS